MGKLLGGIGVFGSAAYLGFWAWVIQGRWNDLEGMALNNIGDFLGGLFGPLAFLWLVLGYFQQGIELRQNTASLKLQADELKNSVEQQKNMVDIANKELRAMLQEREEIEQASRPRFLFREASRGRTAEDSMVWSVEMSNAGADCSGLTFSVQGDNITTSKEHHHHLARGESPILVHFTGRGVLGDVATLVVGYIDVRGRPYFGRWELRVAGDRSLVVASLN